MIVIAHRGSSSKFLENSMQAFHGAIEDGAHAIELDVQLTADNELVIMHDRDLMRTVASPRLTKDLTRKEYDTLKLRNGEAVPFLDHALRELTPKVKLVIEIKTDTDQAGVEVAKLVKPYLDRVVVSSFYLKPLEAVAGVDPDVPIGCLHGPQLPWPYFAHLSPLVFMSKVRSKILFPWVKYLNESYVDQARSRGWSLYPYCEHRREEENDVDGLWSFMKRLGVDGLCSDFPGELSTWLKKNDYVSTCA